MSFELVIFDCDGVLVDSEPMANQIFHEMLVEIGLLMSYEDSMAMFTGLSLSSCLKYVEKRIGRSVPLEFSAQYEMRTMEAFKAKLEPVKGIVAALTGFQKPKCVAKRAA